jgi:selenocysteine lyase/cysteine desulfurase
MSAQPLIKLLGLSGVARALFMFYNTQEEADKLVSAIEKCIREEG